MLIKRRTFIKMGSIASGSLFMPKILHASERFGDLAKSHHKVLVVLQWSGGNDGLNTIIPIQNDIYYKTRPTIAIKSQDALRLQDDVALNPHLPFLKALYDEGSLAILNNVGYENPNRSHFRSMDIWQSASQSDEVWQTGWIGRFLDKHASINKQRALALEVDDTLSLALKGQHEKALASLDLQRLHRNTQQSYLKAIDQVHHQLHQRHHEKPVDYLYQTMASTLQQVDYLYKNSHPIGQHTSYPSTGLGKSLKAISSLILSEVETKIYYVSIGSFDTHNNQNRRQELLFKQINSALQSFVNDLKANNRFRDVLICTFSEFGRRVAQNASNGTDHGTANNMFFISGGLHQPGLLNEMPDLNKLIEGDLIHQVDFKSVYATLLDRWLDTDYRPILKAKYPLLNFI